LQTQHPNEIFIAMNEKCRDCPRLQDLNNQHAPTLRGRIYGKTALEAAMEEKL